MFGMGGALHVQVVVASVLMASAMTLKRSKNQMEEVAASISQDTRPHLVFVLADDLGWNGVGFTATGKANVKTPYIDQLAKDGVVLDAYYVGPYCAPSRFSLLTGRSPWKSEAGFSNFRADVPIGTNIGYTMLPKALQEVGYKTHLVGKWHQGFHMESYLPTARGFDTAYGISTGCTNHITQEVFEANFCGKMTDMQINGDPFTNYTKGVISDTVYRDHAVHLIKEHDQSVPVFIYLSLQFPHEPFQVDEYYARKYSLSEDENVYWGMHSHVDDTVKAVVDALKESNMYSNTLLIFTSDNGATGAHSTEPYIANYPLRGHKGLLYDGGIRVPCLLYGGFLPSSARGTIRTQLTSVEDWYATFAQITGAALDKGGPSEQDSIGNWEYISGNSANSAREEVIQNYMNFDDVGRGAMMSAIRKGKYKAITFGTAHNSRGDPGRDCTFDMPCVYNLELDPEETNDIASSLPDDQIDYMASRMQETWSKAYSQPWFGIDKPKSDRADDAKACKAWLARGGFLVPWATAEDEEVFAAKAFAVKSLISRESAVITQFDQSDRMDD